MAELKECCICENYQDIGSNYGEFTIRRIDYDKFQISDNTTYCEDKIPFICCPYCGDVLDIEEYRNARAAEPEPRALTEWVKCSDRMPIDGESVLVYYGNNLDDLNPAIEVDCAETGIVDYCDGFGERLESHWTYKSYRLSKVQPTHWMPFPKPPISDMPKDSV